MSLKSTLDTRLKSATDRGDVPGLIAMAADRNGVIYEGAFGLRKLGEPAPMTLDTVVWFASMTKAVTGAAAMQMVERGKLKLDEPAAKVCPELGKVQVREGWDAAGKPHLRAPRGTITLRNLLSHTSGFAYEIFHADVVRELEESGKPGVISGQRATLDRALVCDPGTEWNYSPGIDWAGRMVEEASGQRLGEYMKKNLFEPLAMRDTSFQSSAALRARQAGVHARLPDGSLTAIPFELPPDQELDMGGHGLSGTAGDYLRFSRMILNGGTLDGARVLEAKTVATMGENHIGELTVGPIPTAAPDLSNPVHLYPGIPLKWGLTFLINTKETPEGRSAGSLAWAGLINGYYWIDPSKGVTGVFMTQILPFFDAHATRLFSEFETAVYAGR